MSRVTLAILCTVIGLIVLGMYLEVKALSGGVGAFIVIALVYSFVVAKREAALLSYMLDEKRKEELERRHSGEVIVPEWLKAPDSEMPTTPRARTLSGASGSP